MRLVLRAGTSFFILILITILHLHGLLLIIEKWLVIPQYVPPRRE